MEGECVILDGDKHMFGKRTLKKLGKWQLRNFLEFAKSWQLDLLRQK